MTRSSILLLGEALNDVSLQEFDPTEYNYVGIVEEYGIEYFKFQQLGHSIWVSVKSLPEANGLLRPGMKVNLKYTKANPTNLTQPNE